MCVLYSRSTNISLPPFTNGTYLRGEARPQARDLGNLSHSCMDRSEERRVGKELTPLVPVFGPSHNSLPPFTNGTYLRGEARPQARDLGDLSHSCMETANYKCIFGPSWHFGLNLTRIIQGQPGHLFNLTYDYRILLLIICNLIILFAFLIFLKN